jgi:nitrite reductase/ring-hydroxylating ferredoxin subunit
MQCPFAGHSNRYDVDGRIIILTGGAQMKTRVADFDTMPDGKAHCVKTCGVSLVLIRQGDSVRALENKCPHIGLPIGKGKIENGEIVCPFHGSRFSIETGENTDWVSAVAGMKIPVWTRGLLAFGKKPQPVRTFAAHVEDGGVFVEL